MATAKIKKEFDTSSEKLIFKRDYKYNKFCELSTTYLSRELDSDEAIFLALNDLQIELQALHEQLEELCTNENDYLIILTKTEGINMMWHKIQAHHKRTLTSTTGSSASTDQKIKLKPIKFRPYDGELKNYLHFWGQFQRYHIDQKLTKQEKFDYLIAATKEGTQAREFLEKFPPTEDNYEGALQAFKERFGNEKRLKQFYVRGLVLLVLKRNDTFVPQLYDSINGHLLSLNSLGVHQEQLNTLLFPLVEMALPDEILALWERHDMTNTSQHQLSDTERLLSFLKMEANRLLGSEHRQEHEAPVATVKSLAVSDVPSKRPPLRSNFPNCIFCNLNTHFSEKCYGVHNLPFDDIRRILIANKRCLKCMSSKHFLKDCTSTYVCSKCKQNHHSALCPPKALTTDSKMNEPSPQTPPSKNVKILHSYVKDQVFLQTLLINVRANTDSPWVRIRAVLDSGSQKSYVSNSLADKLKLKVLGTKTICQGVFGGVDFPPKEVKSYELHVASSNTNTAYSIRSLGTEVICSNVPHVTNSELIDCLKAEKIVLTDVSDTFKNIELLIGADFYGKLLTGNKFQTEQGPTAVETLLGWTVLGELKGEPQATTTMFSLCLNHIFWDLDVLGITDKVNNDADGKILENFENKIQFVDNRYEVSLPWKEGHPPLMSNKQAALRRLQTLTLKLKREKLYDDYDNIFQEWLADGIIEKAPQDFTGTVHYLPHREVVKRNGTSSFKIRPVFDGSAKCNGVSLNDCLEKGPNLIHQIPNVLNGFRSGKIGFCADIRRAFLQISLCPHDRDAVRFLWYDEDGNIIEFRHCRVCFGLSSSPFHLAATLKHHFSNTTKYPDTVRKLQQSFYVDDAVGSVETAMELKNFISEATEVMMDAQFELIGWKHSESEPNEDGPPDTTVLGIKWNTVDDTLSCIVKEHENGGVMTKRQLLSDVQLLFDPIGFLCPTVLLGKILLKKVWTLNLGWDEKLPDDICEEYRAWKTNLPLLAACKIPRSLGFGYDARVKRSLHVFCDASKDAFATAVFLRSQLHENIKIQLVQAKSRLTPKSPKITIPRLELLAATIGARLYTSIVSSSEFQNIPVIFWTDSLVTLHWLKRPDDWSTFVSNRVREILTLTSIDTWRHVPGKLNPSDLPSRGCSAQQLLENHWWQGPLWLLNPSELWPVNAVETSSPEAEMERKKKSTVHLFLCELEINHIFKNISRYTKQIRVVAYMLRFKTNCKKDSVHRTDDLSGEELKIAELKVLQLVQGSLCEKDTNDLTTIVDKDGLVRVKTRIVNDIGVDNYPILLPGQHVVVRRMVFEEHGRMGHVGILTLLSELRKRFWITRGRSTVKHVVNSCLKCYRFKVKAASPPMAPLPIERTTPGKAFETIGVDAFGPINVKEGKVWGIIFTCCVYRAIHLEIVTSMTSESFLLAFRRFIARRGRCLVIYSDNGTNFIGAKNLLQEIDPLLKIKWFNNPPTASWYGGFFERLIRCVKESLRRSLTNAMLTCEELSTAFCDTEALLNARPLTYVGEDPAELQPLTPSMFLQDCTHWEVNDLDDIDSNTLRGRAFHLLNVRQHLRKRLKDEYLSLLVQRGQRKLKALQVGDVVLVGSDDKKRINWPLGLVLELIPGRDGHSRVARVKCNNKQLVRPTQRLYPLELKSYTEITADNSNNNADNTNPDTSIVNFPNNSDSDGDIDRNVEIIVPTDPPTITTRSGRVVKVPTKLDL